MLCPTMFSRIPRAKKDLTKKQTSIRLSAEADRLREALAEKMGISKSAVLEIAIRDMAAKHGVQ